MKRIFFILSLFILLIFLFPNKIFAQSVIRCGYNNEPCCNFAGSSNSCSSGYICSNGRCVVSPSATGTPRTREGVMTEHPFTLPVIGPAIDFGELFDSLPLTGGLLSINSSTTIGGIISALIPVIFTLAGLILLVMLIAGGFSYLTAGSDPKKAQSARDRITASLVGFVIIFASYWIVQLVGIVFNIPAIQSIFGR